MNMRQKAQIAGEIYNFQTKVVQRHKSIKLYKTSCQSFLTTKNHPTRWTKKIIKKKKNAKHISSTSLFKLEL